MLCVFALSVAQPVSAATNCTGGKIKSGNTCCDPGQKVLANDSAGSDKMCCPTKTGGTAETDIKTCIFKKYINPIIRVLSYIVGTVVVAGMTWGGIQYASSAGDPQKVTKAKASITKALIGMVTFMVFGSFVQFLSPANLTNPNLSNCTSNGVKTSFLGLKTWYAYLPPGSFDKNCQVVSDLVIIPNKTSKGVLPQIVLAIADDLLRITAVIAVAFVITGGVQYITSQGEPGQIKIALSTIINALIGLAIAMAASAVVSFIGSQLAK